MKGFAQIWLIVGIVIIVIAGGAYYFFKVKTPVQKACTMDAKICPDRSSVGRSGPNCEFAPCPSPKATPAPDASREPKDSAASPVSNSVGETANPDSIGANWKTYISKFQDYSFKYPAGWRLIEDDGGITLESTTTTKYIITISGPSINTGESFEATIPRMQGILSKSNITIGKYSGIQLKTEQISQQLNSYLRTTTLVFENLPAVMLHGQVGEKAYLSINLEISDRSQVQVAETIFNRIISTFKFLK